MTVSYKKSSDGGYYTACMTTEDGQTREIDDYYTASAKEPPGQWFVHGREELFGQKNGKVFDSNDLTSDVEAFHNLVKGYNPETGEDLPGKNRRDDRVGLHDFTFSAPKSVSVIWSQASGELKDLIERAQTEAARKGLDFLSSKALSRQGGRGSIKLPVAATIGALFAHGSSRANDPQLHTHSILLNLVLRQDGGVGALDGGAMLKWISSSASLYHADLAWSMRNLGFDIERTGKLFEVAGVPESVREFFSERRRAMEAHALKELERLGMTPDLVNASRELMAKVALETRDQKNELTREKLEKLWVERGLEIGFTADQVREIMSLAEVKDLTPEQLMEESLEALKEIHENDATFSEPALVTAVACRMVGIASTEQIMEAVQRLKNEVLLSTEEVLENGEIATVYTTREMVALERRMLELADRKDGRHVLQNVQISDKLIGEQRAALIAATSDVNSVSIIEGTAGAGKTFTMASIAEQYKANGYDVQGIAVAWKAAKNLKKEANLDAGRAIEGWVNDVRDGKIVLTDKTVVIIDEAGMVGARHMKSVLELAEQAGSKVILLGDTLQQKAIAAGDPLRVIVNQNGSTRLDVIRRQKREEDKVAVKDFFAGKAAEGLKPYLERGAVHILQDAKAVNEKMISDWMASRVAHPDKSHLIIARDNKSVLALNRLAHESRLAAGELGERSIMVKTMDCKAESDPLIEFHVGDTVAVRKNQKDSRAKTPEEEEEGRISNRDIAVIEDIREGVIYARTLVEGKEVVIDPSADKWQHKDGGVALQYGYAVTISSSQGLSEGKTFFKGPTDRASTGVGMSRHKDDCQFYIDKHEHWERAMARKTEDEWIPLSAYTDEDCLKSAVFTMSRESKKSSTLDHQNWRTPDGATVSPQAELEIQRIKDATKQASQEITRIQQQSKIPSAPVLNKLHFQSSLEYALANPIPASADAMKKALEVTRSENITDKAFLEATSNPKTRVMSVDADGERRWYARREDGAVVAEYDDSGKQLQGKPLSDRFPVILEGSKERVDIVESGLDALRLRSIQIRDDQERSTIIVSDGRDERLGMPHVRDLIENAKEVHRFDREVAQQKELQAQKQHEAPKEQQRLTEERKPHQVEAKPELREEKRDALQKERDPVQHVDKRELGKENEKSAEAARQAAIEAARQAEKARAR